MSAPLPVLILDGGVLSEWLVERFEAEHGKNWPTQTFHRHFLHDPNDLSKWEAGLKRYPSRIVASAYALAEVQRHVRDWEKSPKARGQKAFRLRFWGTARDTFLDFPVTEKHVEWTALPTDAVLAFGPADASLVALGKSFAGEGRPCLGVTCDEPLRLHCQTQGVKATHPSSLADD